MTSWTSLPTEEAFITLRALGRVALTDRGFDGVSIVAIVENKAVLLMEGLGSDVFVGVLCAIH